MAGIETEFNGEAWSADGASVGYLPQEPSLIRAKIAGNVMEGVGAIKNLIDRFNEVALFAEPLEDDEMNKLLGSKASYKNKLMPRMGGSPRGPLKWPWTR